MSKKPLLPDLIHNFLYKVFKIPNSMNVEISTPPKYKATLVFIHGIGVSKEFWNNITEPLAQDCQIIKVDLLGFGQSTRQKYLKYSIDDQVKSLFLTLVKHNKILTSKPTIFVGHSMGALIATEFAQRFKLFVNQLVLVSPPIYLNKNNLQEQFLNSTYQTMLDDKRVLALTLKLGQKFFGYTSNMSEKSRQAFSKSLSTAIMKQDTFTKLSVIKVKTYVIYGKFDPLIIVDNLEILPKINENISIESTFAAHDVKNLLARKVIKRLKKIIDVI
ncbi:MAG: alpha/beta fold hydrolase [Candidatus Saccharibacteria bacterium]|nr:alpha/beta fold hydrolase [Candidatus Saccharibacteria bacterium]